MTEWFGLTFYGSQDPIKDMLRPDYKEPKNPPVVDLESGDVKFTSEFEVDSGPRDGFAYGSAHRLLRLKHKGLLKTVGPYDMYRYAGATSMELGWFLSDPSLENETWYKQYNRHPIPFSEQKRFVSGALRTAKYIYPIVNKLTN